MPEKDPTTWTIATWMLAVGMAFGGGLVSFYQRYKQRHRKAFTALELAGEIATSAFVGLGVFMLLSAVEQSAGICAAGAGVGGHMGTRLLFFTEVFITKKLKGGDDETK
jgi:hypothetical protein